MRHGSGNRRNRGRNNGSRRNSNGSGNNTHNRSHVFDSNGPDVRIRGTAHQIVEKYSALAKDSNSSGDLTLAENYLQHAEHYQRIINTWDEEAQTRKERQDSQVNNTSDDKQSAENDKPAKQQRSKPKEKANDEDLGLPSSILGVPDEETAKKESETA